ncbi:MAG TPA: cupin domain-containing protein [Candidatus Acidoferrales bacterium]|nr:cupin domain-containing protein [Candidatus Acidoferrales bacterium]
MNLISLTDKIAEAGQQKRRMTRLFSDESFRSWMLYFEPGEGTDMHYHLAPETFLVLEGKASVRGLDGAEQIIGKNDVVFLRPKDYYQITNVGTGPLILFGNRSENFGGAHVTAGKESGETVPPKPSRA